MLFASFKLDMATQGVEIATREEKAYREGLTAYPKPPCVRIDILLWPPSGVYESAFGGQLVHELSLRRAENQGVKDLERPTYLIGCDEPHDIEVEPQRIRLLREYFSEKL
ncbi:hypothetical protein DVH24_015524 [Malus domestica]|uniref:Uncharacterized protein n=1 Tax=Malus domestica TaxID=3750 RepID=A0A498HLW4_MALDO|nr:hypothetical protein DVH24_015524 [Malus domestica]